MSVTVAFTEADFRPLEAAPLAWRWTSPSHTVFPAEVCSSIRALGPQAAARVDDEAARLVGAQEDSETVFAAAGDAESVRGYLRDLGLDPSEDVLVSWDRANALLMPWRVFYDWWDAFCYPSSDDVTIVPVASSWVLCYDHEERFRFRRV
jgi:hypothetical protein